MQGGRVEPVQAAQVEYVDLLFRLTNLKKGTQRIKTMEVTLSHHPFENSTAIYSASVSCVSNFVVGFRYIGSRILHVLRQMMQNRKRMEMESAHLHQGHADLLGAIHAAERSPGDAEAHYSLIMQEASRAVADAAITWQGA